MKNSIILHLSVLFGTITTIPFGNIILPYIYWKLHKKEAGEEFSIQACNILNFQFTLDILCYLSMSIMWYSFMKDLVVETRPDYSLMIYPMAVSFFFGVLYPIIVALIMLKKSDKKMYYPKTIRVFKSK